MNEEMIKVLRMVEEGKIGADEGSQLIQLIKDDTSKSGSEGNYSEKSVRIKVLAEDVTKVNLTIPLKLIQVLLKIGKGITASIPEAGKYLTDVDFDVITEAIEQQIEGNIIDLETEEGDRVLISIE